MTVALSEADAGALRARWIAPLSDEEGLRLIDVARSTDDALLLPVRLDMGILRAQARAEMLPAILRGLVRTPTRRAPMGGFAARRLAGAPESEWDGSALSWSGAMLPRYWDTRPRRRSRRQRAFKELGFDSLGAVEFRTA